MKQLGIVVAFRGFPRALAIEGREEIGRLVVRWRNEEDLNSQITAFGQKVGAEELELIPHP